MARQTGSAARHTAFLFYASRLLVNIHTTPGHRKHHMKSQQIYGPSVSSVRDIYRLDAGPTLDHLGQILDAIYIFCGCVHGLLLINIPLVSLSRVDGVQPAGARITLSRTLSHDDPWNSRWFHDFTPQSYPPNTRTYTSSTGSCLKLKRASAD